MDDDAPDEVEELMARCLEAAAADQAAALEALCAAHPAQAAEIRRRAEVLRVLWSGAGGVDDEEPLPARLGDFEPLERLGAGGMGVVYRARQLSLGRDVALKLVRHDRLYLPGVRARFRREVEAVARLKHPGIVPVHAVGEERGLPYLALELVEGATLAELLAALHDARPERLSGADLARALRETKGLEAVSAPGSVFELSWVDAALELARQLADALEHAHSRGMVHRDVKPSNVLLTARGRAMLLDFGLASSAEGERLTRSGHPLGTLHYMAPEQVRGTAEIDARADVYALGVTLYELLCLQPPYEGPSPVRIELAILAGELPPLRARNHRVGREVELVCRTALELDPARRYASAALFARDLENLLARRPIFARPPGPALRLARFARRNPTVSVAGALGMLLVAGIPSALYLQQRAHATELQRALDEESAARTREQAALDDSDGALTFLVTLFRAARPEHGAGRELTVAELLAHGAEDIGSLAERPLVQARLLQVIGDTFTSLGRPLEALPLLERAVEIERRERGELSEYTLFALDSLAGALHHAGRLAEAEEIYRRTLAGQIELRGARHEAVANTLNDLALVLLSAGRNDEALDALYEAVELHAASDEPRSAVAAMVYGSLAEALLKVGQAEEARLIAEESLAILAEHHAPPHPLLANARNLLGMIARRSGELELAAEHYGAALVMLAALHEGPHDATATALTNLGLVRMSERRFEEAAELYERAERMLVELGLADHPYAVEARARAEEARARAGGR